MEHSSSPEPTWRPVILDGEPWPYEVGDHGQVRRKGRPRPLKGTYRSGYHRVSLSRDGVSRSTDTHRLVAAAFLGPSPSPDHVVDHVNDDRADNRVENLRWVTRSENRRDSAKSRERIGRARYESTPDPPGERWERVNLFGEDWPYEVSSEGRVRRVGKTGTLRPGGASRGYLYVGLSRGGRVHTIKIHTLVAWAFHGAPASDDLVVNHIDGGKQNNAAENLEWVTPRQNARHAREEGLQPEGSGHVLTNEDAEALRREYEAGGVTQAALAERWGVSQSSVSKIVRGERYRTADGPTKASHQRTNRYMRARGEDHPSARLTEAQVVEIRRRYAAGDDTQTALAGEYGVPQATISSIVLGKSWKDAGGPISDPQWRR